MTGLPDCGRVPATGERHYAVVDLGSNSVRLVVYDQLSRAPLPRFNEKSLCRLGEGLEQTGTIAPDAFERALEATRRFRAVADSMDVGCIDVLATEAIRRASNGADLVEAIRRESGLQVRVLSGAEEARFASLGVVAGCYQPAGIVADMGGGSVEMARIAGGSVGTETGEFFRSAPCPCSRCWRGKTETLSAPSTSA